MAEKRGNNASPPPQVGPNLRPGIPLTRSDATVPTSESPTSPTATTAATTAGRPSPAATSKLVRSARGLTFLLLAAWILLAPAHRQLFGEGARWVPAWDMYSDLGLELVRARFIVDRGDASGETDHTDETSADAAPVDRYATLGFDDRRKAPRWLRTIRGDSGALRVARAICERLGPGVRVRVDAEIATWNGWEPLFADIDDLCRPLPSRKTTRRRRRH